MMASLSNTPVSKTHPAISLAVTRIHVNCSLAIFDSKMVVVHLAVRGCAIAVEHWVAAVQLDGLGVHLQGVDKLLGSHQVVPLCLQPFCLLLVRCGGWRLLLQLRTEKLIQAS